MLNRPLLETLARRLRQENVRALLVAPGPDLLFLTGHAPYLCERFQAMVVKDDATAFYICNLLTRDEAAVFMDGSPIYPWFDCEDFADVARRAFEEQGLLNARVAVNGQVRAVNLIHLLEKIPFTPVDGRDYVELCRMIKTSEEMENLRRSSRIVDRVYEDVLGILKPGMTERDVKNEIRQLCKRHGGENYDGVIVAVDDHGAMPHYFEESGVLKEDSVVVMDYGCTVGGMYSDITRTVFLGRATDEQRKVYNLVLQANLAGEAAAVCGTPIPEVDRAARRVIEDAGYGPYFNHRLGHGIGYAGHESPYIRGNYDANLTPGMAFSCEPGIYFPGRYGIRIEDVVLINENGGTEVLNRCSKELVELGFAR